MAAVCPVPVLAGGDEPCMLILGQAIQGERHPGMECPHRGGSAFPID